METPNNSGELYNVCSGKSTAIRYILDCLLRASTMEINKFSINVPQTSRKFDSPCTLGNNEKLKNLGWTAEYNLDDTLVETLEYWRQHV